jgi:hypothetical protein
MSMLESTLRKNGHSRYISCSVSSGPPHASTAAPKPYQPGSMSRHWLQLNTHGIARRSSIRSLAPRDAGRLPMLSSAISAIGVEARKYSTNPGVCTSVR